MRTHGTTQARPAEMFALLEAPVLLPAPVESYDTPTWTVAKVHRDHHIQVAKALYSVPGDLIGEQVTVRLDRRLVKVLHRGQVVKIHPRQAPGGRSTDADDLPSEVTAYALRNLDKLKHLAARHGDAVGTYATALLDVPLPWTRMRTVYRLLGLVNKYGPDRVETACRRALECEAVDVGLIARILERGVEDDPPDPDRTVVAAAGRFARDVSEFAVARKAHPMSATTPAVTPRLKQLLRRVKLGKTLDTLPDRLSLVRQSKLTHAEFLELVLANEVDRRNRQATALRARTAEPRRGL